MKMLDFRIDVYRLYIWTIFLEVSSLTIELFVKSHNKLQFVSSKRKEGTKLSEPSKRCIKKFGPEYEATNE